MPGFFSRLKGKDGPAKVSKSKKNAPQGSIQEVPSKPAWEDAWTRKTVEPDEVQELLHGCTLELKSRALDMPFMILPFRPTSDPSAARTFIRNFFDRGQALHGEFLTQELRLTEPMVLCSVAKWCWARLPGGVVSWDAYELFRVGEQDSNMARDSFTTFIPLSVDSDARTKIIFDFFDLLSAIAAHGKTNGLGGRKLSRLAGWWAFEHTDTGKGFEGGYKGWASAANATSHLFFAYLRSMSPDSVKGLNGISTLPMSLQKLVQETEYPPETPSLMQTSTTKVVMIVNSVSPTPFALLRRANHFQYRDDDQALQQFSNYEDPIKALTDECRRVLKSISSANQSQVSSSKRSTGLRDASWSRFEDIGFSGAFDEAEEDEEEESNFKKPKKPQGLRATAQSRTADGGRPTTPSWADFMSSGFVDETANGSVTPLLLPPDKVLPPIDISRGRSSQSHRPRLESENDLDPGELANITRFDLDDAFWWVWISSLAGEELAERKAAFGRCALVETVIPGGKWLVMEEVVKGAAAEPAGGTYIAEKKSRFGWTRRSKGSGRRKSTGKRDGELMDAQNPYKGSQSAGMSKTSIGPDQHARIQAAAAQLQAKQRQQETQQRRGRNDPETVSQKTNSVFTLQPVIMKEASPAMQWASKYDKAAIREAYLANNTTGRGLGQANLNGNGYFDDLTPGGSTLQRNPSAERDLPQIPVELPSTVDDPPPIVPWKSSIPPPAPMPPTPAAAEVKQQKYESEKAAEVALPQDVHPMEGNLNGAAHRTEPSLEQVRVEEPRAVLTPEPIEPRPRISGSSPESQKHHKLQKKVAKDDTRGFRKMFGRNKNRNSKLPENATTALSNLQAPTQTEGQLQASGATIGRRFSGFKKKSPTSSPNEVASPAIAPTPEPKAEDETTPVQSPEQVPAMSYEPSLRDDASRVDTADQHEANKAFSSFDQGPLEDMPAFVPHPASTEESETEEAAPPPVVMRKAPTPASAPVPIQAAVQAPTRAPVQAPARPTYQAPPSQIPIQAPLRAHAPAPAAPAPVPAPAVAPAQVQNGTELTKDVSPVQVQDRWAQIRKNAAERAAQKQSEEPKGGNTTQSPATTDNDGETSGEETIESRVARIKARVAELTGNMENNGPTPGNRSPARWQ